MTFDDLARRAGEDVRRVAGSLAAPEWSEVNRTARGRRMMAAAALSFAVGVTAVVSMWALAPGRVPSPVAPASPSSSTTVATSTTLAAAADAGTTVVLASDGTELARLLDSERSESPLVQTALDEFGTRPTADDVTLTLGIDPRAQEIATTLQDWLGGSDIDGAVVMVDSATGAVVAAAGTSANAFQPDVPRPVGSLVQPLLAVAAMESGYTLDATLDISSPADVVIDGTPLRCTNPGSGGPALLPLHDAIVLSTPTAFCRLLAEIGSDAAASVVARVWPSTAATGPALALGELAVTPLEVAAAYRTLAVGRHRAPRLVEHVTGAADPPTHDEAQPFSGEHLASLEESLVDVVERGTGTRAGLDLQVSGMTGTTGTLTDAWFAGSTDSLTAVVWIGRGSGTLEDVTVNGVHYASASGGTLAAPLWQELMQRYGAVDE